MIRTVIEQNTTKVTVKNPVDWETPFDHNLHIVLTRGTHMPEFWEQYRILWNKSGDKSPFQSPTYIQTLSSIERRELITFKFYGGDQLVGAGFFRNCGKKLTFISKVKSDYNSFILHADMTEKAVEKVIQLFYLEIQNNKWSVILHKQPSWSRYHQYLSEFPSGSPLFWKSIPNSVCPMLEEENTIFNPGT